MTTQDDGRYFISNSKDQSIKLWDLRQMSSKEADSNRASSGSFDYRYVHPNGSAGAAAQGRPPRARMRSPGSPERQTTDAGAAMRGAGAG